MSNNTSVASQSEKRKRLEELKERMRKDENLPLRKEASNLVFGEGNPDSKILFIGEGPGFWEDQKGIPFVGNAGAFLNQLLSMVSIPRSEVFITNVVHHRPPNNRDPLPNELAAYEPYLDEIIRIIEPQIIVTLGRFSMAKFLPGETISKVHGRERVIEFGGRKIIVLPMYHPAAGLRNQSIKEKLISDFRKIPSIIEKSQKMVERYAPEESLSQKRQIEQMKLL
jgi:DNA polymerase